MKGRATITVTELGAIKNIKVTKKGEGFKVKPTAISSLKVVLGIINPQLGIDTVDEEKLKEPGVSDKVIQVKDVVGIPMTTKKNPYTKNISSVMHKLNLDIVL